MQHTIKNFSVKETGDEIRKALKREFPGVKFSLRGSRGTGYGWFSLSWTDGPRWRPVRTLTDTFRSQGFDGMTDSTFTIAPTMYATDAGDVYEPRYSCHGVNDTRYFSDEADAWARTIAVRGSYWWPEGAEFETWSDAPYYAARALLNGLDLTNGTPEDPRAVWADNWH